MRHLVSSIVAIAIAVSPLGAMAAGKHAHDKPAAATKAQGKKKGRDREGRHERRGLVRVSHKQPARAEGGRAAVKKDGKTVHHAHQVDTSGVGHHEPRIDHGVSVVPASATSHRMPPRSKLRSVSHAEPVEAAGRLPPLPGPNARLRGEPSKPADRASRVPAAKAEKVEKATPAARKEGVAKVVDVVVDDHGAVPRSHTKRNVPALSAVSAREPSRVEVPARTGKTSSHGQVAPSREPREKVAPRDGKSAARDGEMADLVARIRATEPAADKKPTAKPAPAKKSEPATCTKSPIELIRGPEIDTFALTTCDGAMAPTALERLSVAIRPGSAARPIAPFVELAKKKGQEIAPGIHRADERLASRLQAIADRFGKPGAPVKLSVVSGYRPTSIGSMHATGRAVDLRVEGVKNEEVVAFCKTLSDTGCGYYPNSSFVHVDVRDSGAGHVSWIDASGPGETPRYVSVWPPPRTVEASNGIAAVAARELALPGASDGIQVGSFDGEERDGKAEGLDVE